jgi:hypothetical protein
MGIKLKGWQRIGIVMSVVWFFGFAGFVWIRDTRERGTFYGWQLKMCDTILSTNNESLQFLTKREDRGERADENAEEYLNCRAAAERLFLGEMSTRYSGIPILLAVDCGIIVICWLVSWLVVKIRRWTRRGFA